MEISANVALACEEGWKNVGNCGSFSRRRRNFTRISQASNMLQRSN